jgi:hypothetical protein
MNPLHIYCRLRDVGIPKQWASFIVRWYEKYIFKTSIAKTKLIKNLIVKCLSYQALCNEIMLAKRFKRTNGLILLSVTIVIWVLFSPPSFAQAPPTFSIGGYGGIVLPMYYNNGAIEGYSDLWSEAGTFGIGALYRFKTGLAFELFAEQITMKIEDDLGDWGELEITPVFLLVKYQKLPRQERGLTYHFGGGLGLASSDFEATRAGTSGWNFSNDTAILLEGDLGIDYFFTKNFSLAMDCRIIIGHIDSHFTINGEPGGDPNPTFRFDNLQFLVGVKVWF